MSPNTLKLIFLAAVGHFVTNEGGRSRAEILLLRDGIAFRYLCLHLHAIFKKIVEVQMLPLFR